MSVFEFMRNTMPFEAPMRAVLALERRRRRSLIAAGFVVGTIMAVVGVVVGSTSVNAALVYLAVAMLPTTIVDIANGNAAVWAFVFPFQAVLVFGASIGLLVASVPLGNTAVTAVVSLLVLVSGVPTFMFLFCIITSRNVGGRDSDGGRRGSR